MGPLYPRRHHFYLGIETKLRQMIGSLCIYGLHQSLPNTYLSFSIYKKELITLYVLYKLMRTMIILNHLINFPKSQLSNHSLSTKQLKAAVLFYLMQAQILFLWNFLLLTASWYYSISRSDSLVKNMFLMSNCPLQKGRQLVSGCHSTKYPV